MRGFRRPVAAAALAALAAGCSADAGPEVRGEVTLDGRPADRVRVSFHPIDGRSAPVAGAETGADGTYLAPAGGGFRPGGYRVTAVRFAGAVNAAAPDPAAARSTLPARYADPRNSPLGAVLGPGPNTVDLALESKPGPGPAAGGFVPVGMGGQPRPAGAREGSSR